MESLLGFLALLSLVSMFYGAFLFIFRRGRRAYGAKVTGVAFVFTVIVGIGMQAVDHRGTTAEDGRLNGEDRAAGGPELIIERNAAVEGSTVEYDAVEISQGEASEAERRYVEQQPPHLEARAELQTGLTTGQSAEIVESEALSGQSVEAVPPPVIAARVAREPSQEEIQFVMETLASDYWTAWRTVLAQLERMEADGIRTEALRTTIEEVMLSRVQPLPASDIEGNLTGYRRLAVLRPDSQFYADRVAHYQSLREAAEREEALRIQRQRDAAIARLTVHEDPIDRITRYEHPNTPRYRNSRSTAYLTISHAGIGERPTSDRIFLLLSVQYTSDRWLFVDEVTAYHNGISEPLVAGRFDRDYNSTIWEWTVVAPDEYQIEVLRSLASADDATLRFRGLQYYDDVVLSEGDRRALLEVLEAYEAMIAPTPSILARAG